MRASWRLLLVVGLCFMRVATPQKNPPLPSPPASTQSSAGPAQPKAPQSPSKAPIKAGPSKPSKIGAIWPALLETAGAHKTVAAVMCYLIVAAFLWSLLLWSYPLALLAILRRSDIAEFTFLGLKFRTLEYVLLLPLFAYRQRVLDAWIDQRIAYARDYFQRRESQNGRDVWIEFPVKVDATVIPKLSPNDLKPIFRERNVQILINGEGGAGKTSLACRIGYWGMAENSGLRLRPHYMLPLLMDYNFIQNAQTDNILEPLTAELERLSGTARNDLPSRFQAELFSQGRVLVILDSLSERSTAVREYLTARAGVFPLQCAVFTSRTAEKEVLAQTALVRAQPLRLQGYGLEVFMRTYLNAVGRSARFSEREVRDLCERLSDVAGDRDITALLATIYARTAIRRKIGQTRPDDPQNIPALMVSYVREISERAGYQ